MTATTVPARLPDGPGLPSAQASQLVLTVAYALHLALGLAVTVLLGRALPLADFGFYAVVAASLALARDATELGTSAATSRGLGDGTPLRQQRGLLQGLVLLRSAVAVAMAGAALLAAWQQVDPARRAVLCAVAACLLAFGATAFNALFNARQRQLAPAVAGVLGQSLLLLACFVVVHAGLAAWWPAALLVAKEALVLAALAFFGRRLLDGWPGGMRWRAALRAVLACAGLWALVVLLRHVLGQTELASVALWHGGAQAGAYAAAQRPIAPCFGLPFVATAPLVPLLAQGAGAYGCRLLGRALVLAAALGGLAAVGAWVLAPDLVHLLYGGRFDGSGHATVAVLRWLAPTVLPVVLLAVLSTALLAWRRERAALAAVGLALALKVLACAVAVPRGGAAAAAAVGFAVEWLLVAALAALLWPALRGALRLADAGRVLLPLPPLLLTHAACADVSPAVRIAAVAAVAAMVVLGVARSRLTRDYRDALRRAGPLPARAAHA